MTMPRAEADVDEAWALYSDFLELQGEGEQTFLAGITKMFVGGVIGRAGLPDSADAVFTRSRLDRDVDPGGEQISVEAGDAFRDGRRRGLHRRPGGVYGAQPRAFSR
jgi:hypothetical protein